MSNLAFSLALAQAPGRTTGLYSKDRVPDFVPGRFSMWLFAKHQRKDGQRIEDGGQP